MLNLSAKTKKSTDEVIKEALDFFGPGGHGLEVVGEAAGYASFKGGGGGVEVIAKTAGGETTVDIASQEWDYQAREFIGKLQ